MFNVYSEQISYLSKTAVTSIRNRDLNLSDRDDAELCVGISGEMFSNRQTFWPQISPSAPPTQHRSSYPSPAVPYLLDRQFL